MGDKCKGRCACHRAAWDVLDRAAGIPPKPNNAGRKPYEQDAEVFRQKLRQAYQDEQEDEPDRPPSYRSVGDRLGMDRRTVKRTCVRLGVSFGPSDPPPYQDLRGGANGRATCFLTYVAA